MSKITLSEVCKLGFGFTLGYLTYKLFYTSLKKQQQQTQSKQHKKTSQKSQSQQKQIKTQQQQNRQQLTKLKQLEQCLIHKSNDFQIETLPENENILTKKCLYYFFNSTYDIFDGKQIVEITLESRKARRQILAQIINKYQTYFRFVCTLDQSIKYMLEKVQKDFAIFLNLDFKKVMDSISYHVDNEEDTDKADQFRLEVVKIMATMRENLTNYMPLFNNPITKAQLQQILTYQTELLINQQNHLIQLLKKMGLKTEQEQQALPLFLTCYIEDKTWQKFGIQSQQMSVSVQDMDQQLKSIFEKFKKIRESTIRQMHMAVQGDIIIGS